MDGAPNGSGGGKEGLRPRRRDEAADNMGHPGFGGSGGVAYDGGVRVSVLYFGVLTELVGSREAVVEVAAGTSVAGLLGVLRVPEEGVWKALAVAVNREYAGLGTVLEDGDEVALLPPVSGGAG